MATYRFIRDVETRYYCDVEAETPEEAYAAMEDTAYSEWESEEAMDTNHEVRVGESSEAIEEGDYELCHETDW